MQSTRHKREVNAINQRPEIGFRRQDMLHLENVTAYVVRTFAHRRIAVLPHLR